MHGHCYHCNTRKAKHRMTDDGRIICEACGADVETGRRPPRVLDELKPDQRCDLPLWTLTRGAA